MVLALRVVPQVLSTKVPIVMRSTQTLALSAAHAKLRVLTELFRLSDRCPAKPLFRGGIENTDPVSKDAGFFLIVF